MAKKGDKKNYLWANYNCRPRKYQRNGKNYFYLSWLGSFQKRNQRVWLKILHSIAVRLATGKVSLVYGKICSKM